MEQKEQEQYEGMTYEQTMKVAEELTQHCLKKIAEADGRAIDMPPIMASTVILMVESTCYAIKQQPDELYDFFNKCLAHFRERCERVKAKLEKQAEQMPQA